MRSAPFGRRLVEGTRPDLALVPGSAGHREASGGDDGPDTFKERIRTVLIARIDPSVAAQMSRPALRAEVAQLVHEIATSERAHLNESEEAALATELTDDMIGLGPLEPFLEEEDVNDILVNGPSDIYVERYGKLEKTTARFRNAQHLVNVAQRIASAIGRRVDEASPMVDARLLDGSRVNIVLPPLVLNGGTISIRKFAKQDITFDVMVRQKNLSQEMARFLEIAALSRVNILISGGTGSGKTTLLNAISRYIGESERIVTIEEAVELRLQQPHVVQMETRTPNIEGIGEITQRALVRNSLRMRPDRIIVGEVRGAEAFDMLQAMNTGHEGSMSTIHANSPRDALYRLENMLLMANLNLPIRALRMQIASALNLIVQIERMRDGHRRLQNIVEITGLEGDVITLRDVFTFQQHGEGSLGRIEGSFEATGLRPNLVARAALIGLEKELLETVGIGRA
jgi:pilus assembly protein CpaF